MNVKKVENMLRVLDRKSNETAKSNFLFTYIETEGAKGSLLNLFHSNQENSGTQYVNLKSYESIKNTGTRLVLLRLKNQKSQNKRREKKNTEYNEFAGDEKLAMY